MRNPAELREQARRYRRLTAGITDQRVINAITELAAEYESAATALESAATDGARTARRLQLIRERAYRLWEEQGRPHGRHADHWHAAERGLDDTNGG
ncbi:MAG TPA: DUF2934 domain-containing protein [Rhodopila sp.]